MNYEKKYKEALGWMQSLYKGLHGATKEDAEHYFPELKESEDERIRKTLIDLVKCNERSGYKLFNNVSTDSMITWLEKQGEPEDKGEISDGYHTFNELYSYRMLYNAAFFNLLPKQLVHKSKRHHDGEECFGGGWFIVMANLPTGQISNHYELKDWDLFQIPEKEIADEWDGHTPQEAAERLHKYLLFKQGEQPTDKIEPKFKVGDWVVGDEGIFKISQYEDDYGYNLTDTTTGYVAYFVSPGYVESNFNLWTIKDAKDGDVLYSLDSKQPFIYKERPQFSQARGHCCINKFGEFAIWNTSKCVICTDKYIPATKEQRYLLFQKMKEAGYEWDAEKKELKKIEPKALNFDEAIALLGQHY